MKNKKLETKGLFPPLVKGARGILFGLLLFSLQVSAVSIRTSFISVNVSGVVPGVEFSLRENGGPVLKIFNKGGAKVNVKVEAVAADEEGVISAETGWIKFEKEILEIPADSSAETDVVIKMPKEKRYFGKRFCVYLLSRTASGGKMFSAGLRSKLFFQTVERKTLWKKIKGIFKK